MKGNSPTESAPAPALERGFRILEQLAASRKGLTLSELARRLGLAKSTTHHLLATLRHVGYVSEPDASGRYFAAMKLADLGGEALSGIRLRSQTAPLLRDLQAATGLTVHLAIWEQGEVVLVEKVAMSSGPRVATWVGRRMDAHCTGCGKAILAHLPPAALERQLQDHALAKHNENTLASPRKLKLSLEAAREAGYALEDEEDELGYRCLGAPVFEDGAVIAAVSIAGTTDQVRPDNLAHLSSLLIATARRISGLLGDQESIATTASPGKAGERSRRSQP